MSVASPWMNANELAPFGAPSHVAPDQVHEARARPLCGPALVATSCLRGQAAGRWAGGGLEGEEGTASLRLQEIYVARMFVVCASMSSLLGQPVR